MASLAFYISGHGFGHASRQIEIINALARRGFGGRGEILIRTSAPRWLFDRTVRLPFQLHECDCDTGIVQIDSLRLDEEETVRRAGSFYARFEERTAREAAFLHNHGVDLVIADAPPLACAAAEAAGVRSIVIGNFTWDWIYAGYAERFERLAPHVLPTIRDASREATGALRLPLHGGFESIRQVTDLPYVARHAQAPRERVWNEIFCPVGASARKPIALSSFGGYGVRDLDLARLDCLETWTVVVTGRDKPGSMPPGVVFVDEGQMYAAGLRYEDLVAAADVVVTKPGYGIISECLANETAMLYTSRGHFVEYDVMVREMPRVLRCRYIDQDELLAGRWCEPLNALLESPAAPERPPSNGADVAAAAIEHRLKTD